MKLLLLYLCAGLASTTCLVVCLKRAGKQCPKCGHINGPREMYCVCNERLVK